ncbi:DUF4350 domain-containing protein [Halpernia frigidisoli]|uniref:DUF4350 domain-containing protein n=1 Tax=Halpernia frigidisoli TaxID=1125876 RepID=A0A1I3J5X6_9FLAO|nr:DUF4350 domain-containing protein [Halpernia frigidisoli]SFI55637.1 hypothetical protein SAMN05443292_2950 [Halpernia frigidisoli]
MSKTFKIYGILFLVIALLLGILEMNKKEIVDWRKNFDINSKSPFGLYVFNKEVNALLKNKVIKSTFSPYSYYAKKPKNSAENILLVNQDLEKTSADKLLEQVRNGSDAILFNESFPKYLEKELQFLTTNVNDGDRNILKLTDLKFKNDSLDVDKFPSVNGFYYLSKQHEILGKSDFDTYEVNANFIKIKYGKGHIYLHTEPLVLTNYYILKPQNKKYVEDLFSYLPDRKTVWFVDTKSEDKSTKSSPLSFILANPPLRYAWYLLWIGLILFVIFNVKRKQRIVPLIEPLENKSVEFIKSIGNLYLQEGDFHDMMAKKCQYFLHRVRIELMIDTKELDENFAQKLQLKTGKNLDKINEAIVLIKKSQDPYSSVMKEDLYSLNKILDEILPQ